MILFSASSNQLYDTDVVKSMGEDLLFELKHFSVIKAGQILCCKSGRITYMFQTLSDIKTLNLKRATLIAYAPGSIVTRDYEHSGILPRFVFNRLHFPSKTEIALYHKRKTI